MKAVKKIVSTVVVLCLCLSMSVITAFATHVDLYGLSDEDILKYTWKTVSAELSGANDFILSLAYDDLKLFLADKEIIMGYDSVDARDDYFDFRDKKYEGINLDETEEGYVQYPTDNPDDKLYWTYNEKTDKYICKNSKGKTVRSFPKYHIDTETSQTSSDEVSEKSEVSESSVSTSSEASTDYTVRADEDVEGVAVPDSEETDTDTDTDMVTNEAAEEDGAVDEDDPEPVTEDNTVSNSTNHAKVTGELEEEVTADEFLPDIAEEPENSNNNIQQILLIIIGILILAGIVVIIVMLRKRKAEEKNEK